MEETLSVLQVRDCWLRLTENWLYQQVRNLPQDIETTIVCWERENDVEFALPHIVQLDGKSSGVGVVDSVIAAADDSLAFGWAIDAVASKLRITQREELARQLDVELIHSHFGNIGWEDISVAEAGDAHHVVTFYGFDLTFMPVDQPVWKKRYAELFDHIDLALFEGPHMAQAAVDLGCPEAKTKVHHLGVDLERLPFQPREWSPGEPLRVLIAGTFKEKKGMPYGLEALSRARDFVEIEVTVIGDAVDKERSRAEKRRIHEIVEREGMDERVTFMGYQPYDELIRQGLEHHVFLSPSVHAASGDTEGGAPVSIIEMLATGMMIVSTDHCDIPNVVRDGEWGLLAPERDVDALVEHLRWFTEHPDEWSNMARKGRDWVEAEFDARKQGERLGQIYREVCGVDLP
jgi:colanic acid/amylovoran biosynthesis glycosyltransferase